MKTGKDYFNIEERTNLISMLKSKDSETILLALSLIENHPEFDEFKDIKIAINSFLKDTIENLISLIKFYLSLESLPNSSKLGLVYIYTYLDMLIEFLML